LGGTKRLSSFEGVFLGKRASMEAMEARPLEKYAHAEDGHRAPRDCITE
jgi:hypothetical protein